MITNKIEDLRAEYLEVTDFLKSVGNPDVDAHVANLPVPPATKEFLAGLLKVVLFLARGIDEG